MSLADTLRVLGWLVRDTFRQAIESRVMWMMLGLSAIAIATCLSVGIHGATPLRHPDGDPDFLPRSASAEERAKAPKSGVDIPSGSLSLAFGAFRVPLGRDAEDAVHFLQLVLAAGAADSAGLLLSLVWTAGFLPAFLAPGAVTVMLAKPIPRGILILGKSLGVLTFVAFQAAVFFLGTWAALGGRTGVWDASYLWGLPLFLVSFAVFYSVSALIAATRRPTVACLLGSLLVWFLCWGMNYGRHAVVAMPKPSRDAAGTSAWLRGTVEAGYWVLPKPADASILLSRAIDSRHHFATVPEFERVQELRRFHPVLSIATSLLAAGLVLAAAVRLFDEADY